MRKKVKIILFMVALFLGLSINIYNTPNDQGKYVEEREVQYDSIITTPKISGYWKLPFIHIDGNWSYTVGNYSWCSGDGSWRHPYIIENIVINASNSPTGNGILIENSKQNYFTIRNCTIFNAGTGIKLENSTNGILTENNCSYNNNGIFIYNYCVNNTIVGNTINDNLYGIRVDDSIYQELHNRSARVFILGNTMERNLYGIDIDGCSNSTISRNTINSSVQDGIRIDNNAYTIISENIITNYDDAIVLEGSVRNSISGNVISNNSGTGITLRFFCLSNTIVGNLVYGNEGYGIWNRGVGPDNEANQMFHNYLAQGLVGVNARDEIVEIWGNVWYNSQIGNYWDDYTGVDANGDGIGDSFYYISPHNFGVDRRPLMNYPAFFSEKPDDITYEIDTTNHKLNWTVVHPKPLSYTVLWNGTLVKSGVLSSQIEDIGIVVDNLPEGDHLFTLEVEHEVIGRTSSDNVTVTVINTVPVFSQKPGNRSYEQGQAGNFLSWGFSDVSTNNSRYTIYRDGFPVITDNPCIPGAAIDLNIDGLYVGVYVFTIEINDGYGGTVQDVVWVGVTSSLYIEIVDQLFTAEEFNITYLLFNENDQGVDFATTQAWWNGTDVSTSVQNIGGGFYLISLDPITVALGEDPILLKIIVNATGYAEKNFEIYIAVDPDTLTKEEEKSQEGLPPIVITIAIGSTIGGVAMLGFLVMLLRRRKNLNRESRRKK